MALADIQTRTVRRPEPAVVHGSWTRGDAKKDLDMQWTAALDALAEGKRRVAGPDVWREVISGNLDTYHQVPTPGQWLVMARKVAVHARTPRPLTAGEREVLRRVLGGDQQKAVAADLAIACSTASKWHTQALEKLHLEGKPIPLPLVVAAQSWTRDALSALPLGLEGAEFDHEGARHLVLSVRRATIPGGTPLTPAEQEVVRYLIEGNSRLEIAFCRKTSTQTVACQLRGVFSKLRATGRYALVRRAVELGWFN